MSRPAMRGMQLLVLLALVGLLFWTVDWREAGRLLLQANPAWVVAAIGLLTLQTILSALRWRVTAGQLGLTIPLGRAIREYYLAQVVNQSLPGGVLGDAGRAFRVRQQAGLLASGQAVIFERFAGQIGLAIILLAALAVNAATGSAIPWPQAVTTTMIVGLAGLFVLGAAILGLGVPALSSTALGRTGQAFRRAVLAPHVRWTQVALSLGTALCNIAAFACCAAAVGTALPPLTAAILVPVILFAMVVPLSIGGWGLREGAAAALFPVAGLAASAGLASSVAFGLVFLLSSLPGLLLFWTGNTPKSNA